MTDNRVLEVTTQRLRPSQALEPLSALIAGKEVIEIPLLVQACSLNQQS